MLVEAAGLDRRKLIHHYTVERELADRLRSAPREQRTSMYGPVYEELLRRVPQHPQIEAQKTGVFAVLRRAAVERHWRFVKRFITKHSIFMEVGAGDCELALRAAAIACEVCAVDVSDQIDPALPRPANFRLLLTPGSTVPRPSASVDVAFSDQLMEHLHPDDALAQVRDIHRALVPGGIYVCITPSRLSGPHDVSAYFDDHATGLHLREYSAGELRAIFREAGFSRVQLYAGARGYYVPVPFTLVRLAEALLDGLPRRTARRMANFAPMRALLGVRLVAQK